MKWLDWVLGRPLTSREGDKEKIGVLTGVPVLGLDALSSTAYGPEAALTVLAAAGAAGFRYFPLITILIVAQLAALFFSYWQTIAAYPDGGGAYIVAKDNLGRRAGVWAAVSLLIDYVLNVAVGISAGAGALVSAVPAMQPYALWLCVAILLVLTFVNLRGVRETGLVFVVPVFVFVVCIGVAIAWGLIRMWQSGGHPQPVVPPPELIGPVGPFGPWLFLAAFASGLTAMTGVEAVSNGVPLFREPAVPNAHRTLTAIVVVLGLFLLALGFLCPAYKIVAMDEQQPGYQTVLSQLVAAVAGRGAFYYVSIAAVFIILTYSAQTSFADFPRVCRLLAEDQYLPRGFANRGRRLVFTQGIVLLAILSGVLLIVFGGITDNLIPLFAVGAFSAFLFSQIGMVIHWRRQSADGRRGRMARVGPAVNALGAVATAVALVIIVVAKFMEGAWIIVLIAPALTLLLARIRRHYQAVHREVSRPLHLETRSLEPPIAIVPVEGWDCVAERAVAFGTLISDDVIAVHVTLEDDDPQKLKELWSQYVEGPAEAAGAAAPRLAIVRSPYRWLYKPILDFVHKTRRENPQRLIAVVIPQLVQPHWYEYLLHGWHVAGLRTRLLMDCDPRVVVVAAPWYRHERK